MSKPKKVYEVEVSDHYLTYSALVAVDRDLSIPEVAQVVGDLFACDYDYNGNPPTKEKPFEIRVSLGDEMYYIEYHEIPDPPSSAIMLVGWTG